MRSYQLMTGYNYKLQRSIDIFLFLFRAGRIEKLSPSTLSNIKMMNRTEKSEQCFLLRSFPILSSVDIVDASSIAVHRMPDHSLERKHIFLSSCSTWTEGKGRLFSSIPPFTSAAAYDCGG